MFPKQMEIIANNKNLTMKMETLKMDFFIYIAPVVYVLDIWYIYFAALPCVATLIKFRIYPVSCKHSRPGYYDLATE